MMGTYLGTKSMRPQLMFSTNKPVECVDGREHALADVVSVLISIRNGYEWLYKWEVMPT